MNQNELFDRLELVARRERQVRLWRRLSVGWLLVAVMAFTLSFLGMGFQQSIIGTIVALLVAMGVVGGLVLLLTRRRPADGLNAARLVETMFPGLNDRLLAAFEQEPNGETGRFAFLQEQVIEEVTQHARQNDWRQAVPARRMVRASCLHLICLAVFVAAFSQLALRPSGAIESNSIFASSRSKVAADLKDFTVSVVPGDTSIERGTSLLVMVRFDKSLPADVSLVVDDPIDGPRRIPLAKSLDDPMFGGRLANVRHDQKYHIEYDTHKTEDYQVTVFDFPELQRADANITFPTYTKLEDKLIEDTHQVTVVEGSKVTLKCVINKPIASASFVAEDGSEIKLVPTGKGSNVLQCTLVPPSRQQLRLELVDAEGRSNKHPPEFRINVVPNRRPDLKIAFPGRDLRVSPLEEMSLEATAWDDYGLKEFGLVFSKAEEQLHIIVLGKDGAARQKTQLKHLLSLEQLDAEPDELLSYYFFADDYGPNGEVRRTYSDMFFAEVRHFEEIFRQGQQPPNGQQQQQQKKQSQQGGQNAQKAEQLGKLQKQIINATWKLIRRETSQTPTDEFLKDARLILESQESALKQVGELQEKLKDAQSKGFAQAVAKHMQRAITSLTTAADDGKIDALQPALGTEQAAYQALLKLRAREHQVVKSQQKSGGGKSKSSNGSNRSQQQLQQLQLANNKNRYESKQSALAQKKSPANREQLQVLSRLRELARRQGDTNKKLKEVENALREAKTEQEKEELRRQLKRLRDEQQEMLRDLDELRNRMEKPENQQQMADSREQLEKTRENVRRASEELKKGQLSKALNAGTRAERDLNKLRDDFRKMTSNQFSDAMKQMRDDARKLAETQKDLADQLKNVQDKRRRTLRRSQEREAIEQGISQQKQKLDNLLEEMKQVVIEAEHTEPLLSKQLYDTIRKARENKPTEALQQTAELLKRGLVSEADQTEKIARRGIDEVRKGIEKAAESVLGSELDALKRAKQDLNELSNRLREEIARNDPTFRQSEQTRIAQANSNQQNRQQQNSNRQASNQRAQQNKNQSQNSTQRQSQNSNRSQQTGANRTNKQNNQQSQQDSKASGKPQNSKSNPNERPPKQQGDPRGKSKPNQQQSNSGNKRGQNKNSQQSQSGKASNQQQQGKASQPQQGRPNSQSKSSNQQQNSSNQQQSKSSQQGKNQQSSNQQQSGNRSSQNPNGRGGLRNGARQRNQNTPRGLEQFLQQGGEKTGPGGPLTGSEFRKWSDKLREVEEIIEDPKLRSDIAKVRERAKSMRLDFKRHEKTPQWDLVKMQVLDPLVEMQKRLSEEILKRGTDDALVPIDRDPVPERFSELVKEYYKRLGSGQ